MSTTNGDLAIGLLLNVSSSKLLVVSNFISHSASAKGMFVCAFASQKTAF
jgi:hypothetical protein